MPPIHTLTQKMTVGELLKLRYVMQLPCVCLLQGEWVEEGWRGRLASRSPFQEACRSSYSSTQWVCLSSCSVSFSPVAPSNLYLLAFSGAFPISVPYLPFVFQAIFSFCVCLWFWPNPVFWSHSCTGQGNYKGHKTVGPCQAPPHYFHHHPQSPAYVSRGGGFSRVGTITLHTKINSKAVCLLSLNLECFNWLNQYLLSTQDSLLNTTDCYYSTYYCEEGTIRFVS